MMTRTPALCFIVKSIFDVFARYQKKLPKRNKQGSDYRFPVVNINITSFVLEIKFHKGRRSPMVIWLSVLIFINSFG